MKKLVNWLAGILLIAIIFCGCAFIKHQYPIAHCEVVAVEGEVVTVVDPSNNLWQFKGTDYIEGQVVTIRLFDNINNDRSDDVIYWAGEEN